MLRWTADNRPLVWTVTPGTTDLYSLYVNGWLYRSHMNFDEFYPLYRQLCDSIRAAA